MDVRSGNTKTCPICDRRFSNGKALGGHMRTHPERQRRGVTGLPGASYAATENRGQQEVSPEIPADVKEAATILLEIVGKMGLAVGGSGEESEQNEVVEGIGSDQKNEKTEDPDRDTSLGSGSGRFKCLRCKIAFASLKALAEHRLKHTREGSGRSRVSDPGPAARNGSAREVGGTERIREEGSSVEPAPSYQQTLLEPAFGLDAKIPGINLVVDLNFPAEPKDD